jgi:hypothetical protein
MNLRITAKRVPLKMDPMSGMFHVTLPGVPDDLDVDVKDVYMSEEFEFGHVDLVFTGVVSDEEIGEPSPDERPPLELVKD